MTWSKASRNWDGKTDSMHAVMRPTPGLREPTIPAEFVGGRGGRLLRDMLREGREVEVVVNESMTPMLLPLVASALAGVLSGESVVGQRGE